jgi:AcrR family transcriptional regulator
MSKLAKNLTTQRSARPVDPGFSLAERRAARREGARTRSDDRYSQIREVAAQMFHEHGYAATSLEDIAKAVGMNRATLYYYVRDKDELLIDILGDPLLDMTQRLVEICELDLPASERLSLAIQRHMITLAEQYPGLFIFFSENLHILTVGTERDIVQNSRLYADVFTQLIRDGQDSGEFAPDVDARISMLGIIGMCNWTHRWFQQGGALTLPQIGEQFSRMAVVGLAVKAGSVMPSA